MALLKQVNQKSFNLKQAGRGDALAPFRTSVRVCFDKIAGDDDNARDELERACAGVKGAYDTFAAGKCTEKDAEAIAGLYKAGLDDGIAPLDALAQLVDAIEVVAAVRADRASYDELLLKHGGLFRRTNNGGWEFRTGEEILARREADREYYAKTKEPGYVPKRAAVANEAGHALAAKKELDDERERAQKLRNRISAAVSRAGLTVPADCEAIFDCEGKLRFEVMRHIARLVDEPNPPCSWDEAAERAVRFRRIFGLQTRAEYEGGPRVYSGDKCGHVGEWHVDIHWPRNQKTKRRFLIDPKSGEEWFDIKQDAIDLEEAWYEAECPPGWLKPKPRKKPKFN